MPIPLADSIAAALSDRTTALAAAFIIGTHHADVLQWVTRTIFGDTPAADIEPRLRPKRRSNGRSRSSVRTPKRNGVHREPRGNGAVSYSGRRRAERDKADSALAGAMRDAPGASIVDLAAAIGRSRSSVVSALQRLRDAGLVENEARQWRLLDELAPRDPAPPWVSPLKGKDRSSQAHLTAS